MPYRRSIRLLLATGHVVAMIGGATLLLPDRNIGAVAQASRWHGSMSRADSNYGFFAPAAGSKHRSRFLLSDATGVTSENALAQANSAEARLRLSGIIEQPFMSGQAATFLSGGNVWSRPGP